MQNLSNRVRVRQFEFKIKEVKSLLTEEFLNELGAEGWQVAHVFERPSEHKFHLILQRELPL
jgi:hypothetical protein